MGKSLSFKSLFKSKNTRPLFPFSCHFHSCTKLETPYFRMPLTEEETLLTTILERSSVEVAMHALNSKRPCIGRNIIGKELALEELHLTFEGSIAVEMESKDIYNDFKFSMKEMLEASYNNREEVKDAAWFEEMLQWYLRMNVKWDHGYIIKAYVDLLFESISGSSSGLSGSSSVSVTCSSSSFTCPSS